MNEHEFIEVNPDIMLGKPVIKGTRIPAALVLRKFADGATMDDLLDGYPGLTKDKIMGAISYAAEVLGSERVVFLKTGTGE